MQKACRILLTPVRKYSAGDGVVNVPLQLAGAEIGSILLDANPEHPLDEDDLLLVNAVAQQLSQQIETLRLLEEAQHSRSDAEQAFVRLARQGVASEDKLSPLCLKRLGEMDRHGLETNNPARFTAEGKEKLSPRSDSRTIDQPVLNTPFQVSDVLLEQLQIGGEQAISEEDANLVETIAQRLSQQMENLRLLDEFSPFPQRG